MDDELDDTEFLNALADRLERLAPANMLVDMDDVRRLREIADDIGGGDIFEHDAAEFEEG